MAPGASGQPVKVARFNDYFLAGTDKEYPEADLTE